MKKLIAVLSIVILVVVACLESNSFEKASNSSIFDKNNMKVVSDTDNSGSQDSQDPSFPRI